MQPTQPQNLDRNQYLQKAKADLETIERGLLNLSGVVQQPESLQRLYKAAQDLNTGALTHQLESIQEIAQFFEDCFGVMLTASVISDKHLEELLWRVFDTFSGLLDMHLMSQEPTEYTQGVEREVVKGLQPTLSEARNYLKSRILHEEATISELTPESGFFQEQVEAEIEAMESILKQNNPSYHRAQLKEHCQVLEQIGAQAQLPEWVKLLKTANSAIAATENSVKIATQSAIADIREAQRLIKTGAAHKIKPSQRLKAMSLQLSSPWDTKEDFNGEKEDKTVVEGKLTPDSTQIQIPEDELELDEKATIADLDGIPETSDSEDLDFLASLELDRDFWDGEEIDVNVPANIENSGENLELWDEQPTLTEDSDEWWSEKETAIEDDGIGEDLDQWLTQNDEEETHDEELWLFEEDSAIENSSSSDDEDENLPDAVDDDFWDKLGSNSEEDNSSKTTLTQDEAEEDEEWNELFSIVEGKNDDETPEEDEFLKFIDKQESSPIAEQDSAMAMETSNFSNEDSENLSWSESLEDIFSSEEKTFIQGEDKQEHSTWEPIDVSGGVITLVEGSGDEENIIKKIASSFEYYETIDHLEALIDAPPTLKQEQLDLTALESYLESISTLSSEETEENITVAKEEKPTEIIPTTPVTVAPQSRSTTSLFEQTVKVPVRLMDHLSNLIGELVVNRNSLEQDQERLRRFLDNLLEQVQNLNDLGVRMQDLYERSLLENSLLASKSHSSRPLSVVGEGAHSNPHNAHYGEYDPLEMDRFSGFHLLSQEMIELIVRVRESTSDIEFLVDEVEQEARIFRQVTGQLQEGFTAARMVPFSQVAERLPRAVRDISLKLNKKAKLQVEGQETLVDKMILEQLYDPMTHLVNNAITHGIEPPEERKASGKAETGIIKVEAHHQGNQSVISISDDGAGLDPVRIRRKAVEKGLISQAEVNSLPDIDVFDFIFHPGFSTKDKADDFAGRGVGMDVVRSSLNKLRGSINIDSTPGKGTKFIIGLPLTLSITNALCCKLNQSSIAFPMDGVEDKFETSRQEVKVNQKGERFIRWQKSSTLLPFKHLSELLSYNRTLTRSNVYAAQEESDEISVVVIRSTGNMIAVQVDQVLGQQEIVIKQLSGPIPKPVGIAGATVTSDGSVMAIADVLELLDLFYGRVRKDVMTSLIAQQEKASEIEEGEAEPMVLIVDDSITVRELLSMTFIKAGYRVEQARDGKEAWEKLRAGLACDMMFCDIEMPRMDGLELLSRVKEEERFADLPVGMLTSRGAERHRQMAARLGARGYFTKPYLEEMLLDAAKRMLKGENMMNRKVAGSMSE